MSIKNMLTAALFKQDDAGRTVMYPNGAMGRGYLVPDDATAEKMRRVVMWLVIAAGLVGGIGMQVLMLAYGQVYQWTAEPWIVAVSALVIFCVGYRLAMRTITRRMTPATQRMGTVEALRRQAEAMPRWYLWTIAVFAPLMVIGSVAWMITGTSMANYALGFVGIILFGIIMAQAIHGLKHRPRT